MLFLFVKWLHILTVAVGVGSAISKFAVLLFSQSSSDNAIQRLGDQVVALLGRRIEAPAFGLAILTGLGLGAITPAYFAAGFMHVKIALVVILFSLAQVGKSTFKRIILAAEANDATTQIALRKRFKSINVVQIDLGAGYFLSHSFQAVLIRR